MKKYKGVEVVFLFVDKDIVTSSGQVNFDVTWLDDSIGGGDA